MESVGNCYDRKMAERFLITPACSLVDCHRCRDPHYRAQRPLLSIISRNGTTRIHATRSPAMPRGSIFEDQYEQTMAPHPEEPAHSSRITPC
jgi:hypothetical protein